jgi:hypothetical protein
LGRENPDRCGEEEGQQDGEVSQANPGEHAASIPGGTGGDNGKVRGGEDSALT